jgi:NDP-sugar pyrophosphorylase family protein
MIGLLLAAGKGTRLGRPDQKCAIRYKNQPLLEYSLDRMSDIDEITDIIMVVGHEAERLIDYYGSDWNNKSIYYVYQREQTGMVDAMLLASRMIYEKDDVFLMLGDEMFKEPKYKEMVRAYLDDTNCYARLGCIRGRTHSDTSKTYEVIIDEDFNVRRCVEKPQEQTSTIQGTGNCIISGELWRYLPTCKDFVDMFNIAKADGLKCKPFVYAKDYVNVNTQEDLERLLTW